MTPKEYEQAVLELFRIDWPAPAFEVRHDVRLRGAKTKHARQIDIAIYEPGETKPCLLVEAKRHGRAIDAGVAGSTIAMVQDLGGIPTIMIAAAGFSVAAANHLEAEEIGHLTITITEAKGLRWIPVLEARFAVDGVFKQVSGQLVEALREGDALPFFGEQIAYEEWIAILETGLSLFPLTTGKILNEIASRHSDDGHRFNAIQILADADLIDRAALERLLVTEVDSDTIELLESILGMEAEVVPNAPGRQK